MQDIPQILSELGYELTPDKDGWRTNALFRGGDNRTAIKIYHDGKWCDFVEGKHGTLEELVKLTLGIDDVKAKDWLKDKIDLEGLKVEYKEKIKLPQIFDMAVLRDLIPDHEYWIKRGITRKTAELFKGGLCLDSQTLLGKLKNRQILCIYNSLKQLVGFTARDITGKNYIKWKHLGEKTSWVWPAYLNHKFVQESKTVILVESPGDILKMWDCDIKNVICLFGTECSHAILNYLLKINPKHIIISTNNEESEVGNKAAEKIYNRLKRYFNHHQLQIKLPIKKDFGEMSCEEILKWYE